MPKGILKRFGHYVLTYKNLPDEAGFCETAFSFAHEQPFEVIIRATMADYTDLAAKLN